MSKIDYYWVAAKFNNGRVIHMGRAHIKGGRVRTFCGKEIKRAAYFDPANNEGMTVCPKCEARQKHEARQAREAKSGEYKAPTTSELLALGAQEAAEREARYGVPITEGRPKRRGRP